MQMISKSDLFDIVEVLFDNFKRDNPEQKIIENEDMQMTVKYIEEVVEKKRGKKKDETINTISLSRAKTILKDLESNIKGEQKNLCLLCRHFKAPINKDYSKDKVVQIGFGSMGRCDSPYRNDELNGPELSVSIWKCGLKETEMKEIITQLEKQVESEYKEEKCDICEKPIGINSVYYDSSTKKKGHKYCIMKDR